MVRHYGNDQTSLVKTITTAAAEEKKARSDNYNDNGGYCSGETTLEKTTTVEVVVDKLRIGGSDTESNCSGAR